MKIVAIGSLHFGIVFDAMKFALFLLLLGTSDAFVLRPGRNSWSHRTKNELSANTVEGIEIGGALEPLSNFVLVQVRAGSSVMVGRFEG